ncbi:NAD(P)/FAD-dependent oxidoreductase [Pelagibacterium flavum]|uniref:NAD(P)/FAD-dependent oxidoreductase n=1 Tax=Pelagibacterium flavum TaxID=2984530 RepID=A0ABY6IRB7_9HYPH|nr:FAD/NAD(P)-binding oxidoreductase [Pelagibacterium sp. YIM 151497]UYQ72260.1 NAD(P)/FAD-dependent oxidoreductase [Pelagibacterium sp. YIM 151497]
MSDEKVDLVVIGSGPAGLAAACEARNLGLSVVVLDEQPAVGGQIYRSIENAPSDRVGILGADYAAGRALADGFRSSGADYRGGATVWNVTNQGVVDYVVENRSNTITGRHVILASGAMERPFPISGWTLPGVMGVGAAQILLKSAGALPQEPVVLAGCGPLLYLLAWQYLRAGVAISAIVDTTERAGYFHALPHIVGAILGATDLLKGFKLLTALRRSGVVFYRGARDLAVLGETEVEGLSFVHRGNSKSLAAKLVLLHQGVVPNAQLSLSTGAEHRWNAAQLCWEPVTDEWGRLGDSVLYVAGDSRGIVGALASADQGRLAALSAAAVQGVVGDLARRAHPVQQQLARHTRIRPFLDALYRPSVQNRIPLKDDVLVCRCEEVTAGQIRGYVKLGCLGPNQTKSFGRSGMGPCQGRLCGLTVTEIIARERGVMPGKVGHYRVRPPVKPILLGDLTG